MESSSNKQCECSQQRRPEERIASSHDQSFICLLFSTVLYSALLCTALHCSALLCFASALLLYSAPTTAFTVLLHDCMISYSSADCRCLLVTHTAALLVYDDCFHSLLTSTYCIHCLYDDYIHVHCCFTTARAPVALDPRPRP